MTNKASAPCFLPLRDIYEPSAVQQLPDGRFLVVEDEKDHPISLFSVTSDKRVVTVPLCQMGGNGDQEIPKFDDLEGLAIDPRGRLYAITSHSRDGEGDSRRKRERLVRFRISGDRLEELRVVEGLKDALTADHPLFAMAAEVRDVKRDGGLNIEALEYDAQCDHLLLGFRSPLLEGRAVVARLENVEACFAAQDAPRIDSHLMTLDLEGEGLRGMCHMPWMNGYLLISGPVAREQTQFHLWFWSGEEHAEARPLRVPGLDGFEHAEGVTPALLDGKPHLLIVSDDGDRAAGRSAQYLLLEVGGLMAGTIP